MSILVVLVSMAGTGTTHATSLYDDAYRTVSTVSVSGVGYGVNCPSQDITVTWPQYLLDSQFWPANTQTYQDMAASLKEATKNGSWAISYFDTTESNWSQEMVAVYWSEAPGSIVFHASGGSSWVSLDATSKMYQVTLAPRRWAFGNGDCTPIAYDVQSTTSSGGSYAISYDATTSTLRNHFVANASVTTPYGYDGIPVATQPQAEYVAMGDSYSSGEGNPSFETFSDTSSNQCHRSPDAYPRELEVDLSFASTAFVACSGATIDDVLNGKYGELPQVSALTAQTEAVTLTVGGNDIGFAQFAANCLLASCSVTSQAYENAMDEIDNGLQSNLEALYRTILSRSGSAEVYVVAYPLLTGDSSNGDCQTFEVVSDLGARSLTSELNDRIASAVENVRDDTNYPSYASRLSYVPANTDNDTSPFDGNFICSTPAYFNGFNSTDTEYCIPSTQRH